jgi:pyruvate kinase
VATLGATREAGFSRLAPGVALAAGAGVRALSLLFVTALLATAQRPALAGGRARTVRAPRPGIIATVGPRSSDVPTLRRMVRGGMTVARINLSHNDKKSAGALARAVRTTAQLEERDLPLLFDLPGGKVRLGRMNDGAPVVLAPEQRFDLVPGGRVRTSTREAAVNYRDLGRHAAAGDRVLLDDGRIELEVTAVSPGRIATRVVRGGALRSKMGLALADRELPFPAMTAQDRRKLAIAVESGADWIGVSMVQSPRNVEAVRRALARLGAPHVKVVAKIESRSALANLDAILDAADAVMIARGDLATAVGAELPAVQARIAARARAKGKPFITASNLLSAMQDGSPPSRANRADVRRARRQGPAWLMLNETALGADPGRIVETLRDLSR